MFFLANWGPNTTTFVVPAEAFPTRAKATCHGLSAASGKIGAALGAAAMAPILASAAGDPLASLRTAMYACAGVAGFGAAWTWVFTTETRGAEAGV
jgi:MFS transporter, PHS family, inorganic phosphate transporter